MSELDRERREMGRGAPTARGSSRPLATDYSAHFHPQIVFDRCGYSRSDFCLVAAAQHHRRRPRCRAALQVCLGIPTTISIRGLSTRASSKRWCAAANEVQAMSPPADFMIFGGDLAQLEKSRNSCWAMSSSKRSRFGRSSSRASTTGILDMGQKWGELFGQPNWTFDHKGVRLSGSTRSVAARTIWTVRKMTPEERMGHMATLRRQSSPAVGRRGPRPARLACRRSSLIGINPSRSLSSVIIRSTSTTRLELLVRDWREVNDVLKPYTRSPTSMVTSSGDSITNRTMRSIGMLATSWPWPYAPEGVPKPPSMIAAPTRRFLRRRRPERDQA